MLTLAPALLVLLLAVLLLVLLCTPGGAGNAAARGGAAKLPGAPAATALLSAALSATTCKHRGYQDTSACQLIARRNNTWRAQEATSAGQLLEICTLF